ncbi:MAG: flagellar biosynthesis protein FlhF [Candidatus Cloacimonadota bacterium]|nr:flagellar biosynthesis protein FlhF [Candidatus Cloacimonadota bacterium]
MKIKKFVASSMSVAMKLIKKDFGDNALIMSTKHFNDEKSGKKLLEVTAAIEYKNEKKKTAFKNSFNEVKSNSDIPNSLGKVEYDLIKKDLRYMTDRIDQIVNHMKYKNLPHIPKILQEKTKELINNDVNPNLANSIIEDVFRNLKGEELLETDLVEEKLLLKIKKHITVSGPIRFNKNSSTVVVLMGPTGVGKTTTIAKMAAHYKFNFSKNVALISLDSFRIAAIDQLKSFAEIASIHFESAYSSDDLIAKMNKLKKYDLILLDTAGINPKDMKQMVQLKEFLRIAKADEIHLILSITTKERDLREAINNYSVFPYEYLIFSKFDATSSFGSILNLSADYDKKISYITNGQNIPEDFQLADRNEISKKILRGKK